MLLLIPDDTSFFLYQSDFGRAIQVYIKLYSGNTRISKIGRLRCGNGLLLYVPPALPFPASDSVTAGRAPDSAATQPPDG